MKPAWAHRFAEFAMAAVFVAVALWWCQHTVRQQVDRLRPESGDPSRSLVRLLNDLKADLAVSQPDKVEDAERSATARANRLSACAARLPAAAKPLHELGAPAAPQALITQLAAALTNYAAAVRSASLPGAVPAPPPRIFALCDDLQAMADEARRQQSAQQAALDSLRRVWLLSLGVVGLGGMLVTAVFYRRLVAPLRAQLNESRIHLERHEKLASLGVLATGIAHEIRNPLTAIKVRLFSLKRTTPEELSIQDDVQVISDEINRLERIVGDFLQFARPPELHCQPIKLGDLVLEVSNLLAPQLAKRSVCLVQEPAPDVWIVADPEKLKQVLINLIQNAAQSIQGKGVVTLRLSAARRTLGARLADVAALEIIDTGAGMPPAVVKRLFDPFFTTKDDGTGLGLPIAARIIELHGGVIEYHTQPQRGTTFRILLPRATNHEEPSPNPAD